jgi:hypothetical protein
MRKLLMNGAKVPHSVEGALSRPFSIYLYFTHMHFVPLQVVQAEACFNPVAAWAAQGAAATLATQANSVRVIYLALVPMPHVSGDIDFAPVQNASGDLDLGPPAARQWCC